MMMMMMMMMKKKKKKKVQFTATCHLFVIHSTVTLKPFESSSYIFLHSHKLSTNIFFNEDEMLRS